MSLLIKKVRHFIDVLIDKYCEIGHSLKYIDLVLMVLILFSYTLNLIMDLIN